MNWVQRFRRYWVEDGSFVTLLVLLLFIVFVMPVLIEMNAGGIGLLNILLVTIFFIGIWSAKERQWVIIASVLFAIHVTLKLIRFGNNPYDFLLIEDIVAALNILGFIYINLRLLFRDEEFNRERIIGAVNVYLLLALLGAFLFEVIQLTVGSSIKGPVPLSGTQRDFSEFMYYSLVSLTTVGYGDIYPVNPMARMLSVLLSSLGILFPAVVIAQIVSLSIRRR